MMNTVAKPMYEWKTINWKKVEINVFKLQKRIYQASKRNDLSTLHKLQKLLIKSWSAKMLATRKVSQDNQGKKTAGIDGVKNLTSKQRWHLAHRLSLKDKVKPVRRVWIDKANSTEKRPLGIPTLFDRARQALVKLALEPEWEAKMEPNSYGFRPGRSAHDAIAAIYNCINQRSKYVLDADIEKCFDKINQKKLMDKLNTFPTLHRIIKRWLAAGVMENDIFYPTNSGTPQGGVISPLLANIALHGMESFVQNSFKQKRISRTRLSPKITLIRYADDLVVLHENKDVIEQCKEILNLWLNDLGLCMKPSKTRICHTLQKDDDELPGFNFLGMEIRQFPVGRTHSGKDQRGKLLGFKTIIKPSKLSQKKQIRSIGEIIRRHNASPQEALIRELNPVIRGWSNYYSHVVSKDVFSHMDYGLFNILRRWALRRHKSKHVRKIFQKYWRIEKGSWKFATLKGCKLTYHSNTAIKRHIKVLGDKSIYDGDWSYWNKRMAQSKKLSKNKLWYFVKQKGKCAYCQLNFIGDELMELDHIQPKYLGGTNESNNFQLLHRHCHHLKTSHDRSQLAPQKVNL